jgi:hypothetical protein
MRPLCRRSTPAVKHGSVQKKNNWLRDGGDYYRRQQSEVVIDRQRPGEGYRHVLTVDDVRRFVDLLPNWNELSADLHAIVLAPGEPRANGWHTRGVVAVCAWDREQWQEIGLWWYEAHAVLLDRLGVAWHVTDPGWATALWTDGQIRAFQLLHILTHELGHHHDRITTRRQRTAARGEPYAEARAYEWEALVWDRYCREFGAP